MSGSSTIPMSILDSSFNGMAKSEFYRSQVVPDVFPGQPEMLVDNWSDDDRAMYCGGEYTPGYVQQ